MVRLLYISCLLLATTLGSAGQGKFEKDVIKTPSGPVTIHFIGHGTLQIDYNRLVIHIDPWSKLADYSKLPKADIILITHGHPDHLDTAAIAELTKSGTRIIVTSAVESEIKKGTPMANGGILEVKGIVVQAVPAYNTTEGKEKFHPKGRDNGYVITLGDKRIYIAGDTENTPEMEDLKNIDIAFLPMNQPYTMLPEQVADAAGKFKPKILYPYHYGDTDVSKLKKLMASVKGVELRIRPMK
jgi:L-ascorbate metabolism protein UlaG (beta-lactamase superfamily)